MVLPFASIREAFDRAGRSYELTFTILASYWYLRWFDMPGVMSTRTGRTWYAAPLILNWLCQSFISFLTPSS